VIVCPKILESVQQAHSRKDRRAYRVARGRVRKIERARRLQDAGRQEMKVRSIGVRALCDEQSKERDAEQLDELFRDADQER